MKKRKKNIEEIKEYEKSWFESIYNCFVSKKGNFEEVKIKSS